MKRISSPSLGFLDNRYAKVALDNLASVAINTSLISDTDSTDDLGSSSKFWKDAYIDNIVGATVFNEAGVDVDFRFEGLNDTHLLFIDGGSGAVMINESNWDSWAKFLVHGGARFNDDFRFQKGSGNQVIARLNTSGSGEDGYNLKFEAGNRDMLNLQGSGALQFGNAELTGIVFNENSYDYDIRFEGNNDENLLYLDAGNDRVGIGESSPDQKLDIIGNFQIKDAATQTKAYRFRTSGGSLDFEAAGAQWLISNWSGADYTGTQRYYLLLENGASIAQAINTWQWRSAANGTTRHIIDGNGATTVFNEASEDIDFKIEGLNVENLLFVDASTDRVGIGTNVPSVDLHLVGGATTEFIVSTGTDSKYRQTFRNVQGASLNWMWGTEADEDAYLLLNLGGGQNRFNNMGRDFVFRSSSVNPILHLENDNGNVGIAISVPLGKLHIDQTSTSGAVPVLILDQADVDEDFLKVIGTSDTNVDRALVDAVDFPNIGAIKGYLKVNVQDDQSTNPIADGDYYIPFYAVPTA